MKDHKVTDFELYDNEIYVGRNNPPGVARGMDLDPAVPNEWEKESPFDESIPKDENASDDAIIEHETAKVEKALRESGYYWIRVEFENDVKVGFWHAGGFWLTIGDDGQGVNAEKVQVLSQKLAEPADGASEYETAKVEKARLKRRIELLMFELADEIPAATLFAILVNVSRGEAEGDELPETTLGKFCAELARHLTHE